MCHILSFKLEVPTYYESCSERVRVCPLQKIPATYKIGATGELADLLLEVREALGQVLRGVRLRLHPDPRVRSRSPPGYEPPGLS